MKTKKLEFLEIEDNFKVNAHVSSACVIERTSHKDAKVTVAIPTYKGGEKLVRAVVSVLQQEDFDDFNICIVENNPDEKIDINRIPSVIVNKEDRRERICWYVNEKNIGMCGNWNRCVELCTSPYMVMLHTDDMLMPNHLVNVMKILSMRPKAGIIQTNRDVDFLQLMARAKEPFEKVSLLDLFPGNQLHAPSGMLMRVDYIRKLGGWKDNGINMFDYWMCALFLVHYPAYVTPMVLTYYDYAPEKYKHQQRILFINEEVELYGEVLSFLHFPQWVQETECNRMAVMLMKCMKVEANEINWKVTYISPWRDKWSRRFVKYTRIVVHGITNILDKLRII